MNRDTPPKVPFVFLLLLTAVLLSAATAAAQTQMLGMRFIRVQQDKVHAQMLTGEAGNPWQYRILADLMVEPMISGVRRMGVPQPAAWSFIAFRFLQGILILVLAGIFYRKLGLSLAANLIALSILTWAMASSLYNSDLSFSVFFDVAFYLLAGVLILERRYLWVALLIVPAALNRETSLLIPVMLVAHAFLLPVEEPRRRGALVAAAAGIVIYAAITVGLRLYYGNQTFLTADGYLPGISLLLLNLGRAATWQQLLITYGIVPLLAVAACKGWPRSLRIFFWAVVPVWIIVHFVSALVAETRLLLVPYALVMLPGALFALPASTAAMQGPVSGAGRGADV